jgi:Spy/CpxP family protein refolding chaperone
MKTYLLLVTAAIFTASSVSNAQMRRGANSPRPAIERIESFKKVRMMETLKLDENQSVKLIARYNSHQERMRELERQTNEIYDRLEGQIQSNASESEYAQTFAALREYEKKRSEERMIFFNELKEVLTPKQVAEYMIFERNFARDLREAVRDVKAERLKSR